MQTVLRKKHFGRYHNAVIYTPCNIHVFAEHEYTDFRAYLNAKCSILLVSIRIDIGLTYRPQTSRNYTCS